MNGGSKPPPYAVIGNITVTRNCCVPTEVDKI